VLSQFGNVFDLLGDFEKHGILSCILLAELRICFADELQPLLEICFVDLKKLQSLFGFLNCCGIVLRNFGV
jgi:hypothetical protein